MSNLQNLSNISDSKRLEKSLKDNFFREVDKVYGYEDIKNFDVDILSYVDVLVDGPFVDGLKDRKLRFRGSSNQRIIDVPKSLENDKIVLYADSRFYK